jgi:glycosyltransferase involved in cell wall biosynthesis
MRILLLEPFYTGSHKQWAEGLRAYSRHEIEILGLAGQHWKWRMQGSAPILTDAMHGKERPDLLLYSDMAHLPACQALLPEGWHDIPTALYMHENQITYPWSSGDKDLRHERNSSYGMINVLSCLTADHIFFNSEFHRRSFLDALPNFLDRFPDYQLTDKVLEIADKSQVLSVGISPPGIKEKVPVIATDSPIVLWNHRWAFDKNPKDFFNVLFRLDERNIPFRLVVLGDHDLHCDEIFDRARDQLNHRILHWGFLEDKNDYYRWLWTCDVYPVTAIQDFFGISVVEAIAHGNFPLLPDRLAYPEHIPAALKEMHLYRGLRSLEEKLSQYLLHPKPISHQLIEQVEVYYWTRIIDQYDTAFESCRN